MSYNSPQFNGGPETGSHQPDPNIVQVAVEAVKRWWNRHKKEPEIPPVPPPVEQRVPEQTPEPEKKEASNHDAIREYFRDKWRYQRPLSPDWADHERKQARNNRDDYTRTLQETLDALGQGRQSGEAAPLPPMVGYPDLPGGKDGALAQLPVPKTMQFLRGLAAGVSGEPSPAGTSEEVQQQLEGLQQYDPYHAGRPIGDLPDFATDPRESMHGGERYDAEEPIRRTFEELAHQDRRELGKNYMQGYSDCFPHPEEQKTGKEAMEQRQEREKRREVFLETGGEFNLDDVQSYEARRKRLTPVIRQMIKAFREEFLTGEEKTKTVTSKRKVSEGIGLHPQGVVGAHIASEAKRDPGAIFKTEERIRSKEEKLMGGTDVFIVLDASGSMTVDSYNKKTNTYSPPCEAAKEGVIVVTESIQGTQRELRKTSLGKKMLNRVHVEGLGIRREDANGRRYSDTRTLKPLGDKLSWPDKLRPYTIYDPDRGALGGTPDYASLEAIYDEAKRSIESGRDVVIFSLVDGGSHDAPRASRAVQALRDIGAQIRPMCFMHSNADFAAPKSKVEFVWGKEVAYIEDPRDIPRVWGEYSSDVLRGAAKKAKSRGSMR